MSPYRIHGKGRHDIEKAVPFPSLKGWKTRLPHWCAGWQCCQGQSPYLGPGLFCPQMLLEVIQRSASPIYVLSDHLQTLVSCRCWGGAWESEQAPRGCCHWCEDRALWVARCQLHHDLILNDRWILRHAGLAGSVVSRLDFGLGLTSSSRLNQSKKTPNPLSWAELYPS